MRILVVANPRATAASPDQRTALSEVLAIAGDVQFALTAHRGHATALACQAMRERVDVVVAVGGDGTVNEVVNGLLTDGVHPSVPALGVVAAGSTNVFARALGLPDDARKSIRALATALGSSRTRQVSLGVAGERWFAFTAGFGFDAAVIAGVERARGRGYRSTNSLYIRTALREYGTALRAGPAIRLERADGSVQDGLHFVVLSNASPWTYLGRFPLTPTPLTTFEDGLGVYARRSMAPVSVVWGVAQMLSPATTPGGRGALVEHDVDHVVLRADRAVPFQVDGDYLGTRTELRVRSVPRALAVLC